jgi:XTP/dITP diphosphohydrolase
MRVIVATNNTHKKRELSAILSHHEVITPAEINIEFAYEEASATFAENAVGKARALYELVHSAECGIDIVVADDSGICVNALSGGPGVYSARYGSPDGGATELPADARNALLLQSIAHAKDRSAYFLCCMAAIWDRNRYSLTQETWRGTIADQPRGKSGFGYDPVFFVPTHGCTAAELPEEEKNRISHRGRATRVIAAAIEAALLLT